jgi:hypothetical protein
MDENVCSSASSPPRPFRKSVTWAGSGAGEVTRRSAPRRAFASELIARRTLEVKEPMETSAAMPRTIESEKRRSLLRDARESRQAMDRTKDMVRSA